MKTFIMLNSDWTHTKMNGVYTVQATSYDEARRKIVAELSPKVKRQPILNCWMREGQPLRIKGERNSTSFAMTWCNDCGYVRANHYCQNQQPELDIDAEEQPA